MGAGGRPPLWTEPSELEKLVNDYFQSTKRPTLSGLALHLGIERKTLYNYEEKDEFLHIIKKARERVEAIYEERTIYEPNPTGVIFALKNMGWTDRVQNDTNLNAKVETKADLSKLTDDELRTLAELQRKHGISKA